MRKESREMDSEWALEVMHKAPYITVSFIDEDGKPYGLPLSLASDDDVNWFFHGALEGKKLEAIKAHPEVCLSAVTRCARNPRSAQHRGRRKRKAVHYAPQHARYRYVPSYCLGTLS